MNKKDKIIIEFTHTIESNPQWPYDSFSSFLNSDELEVLKRIDISKIKEENYGYTREQLEKFDPHSLYVLGKARAFVDKQEDLQKHDKYGNYVMGVYIIVLICVFYLF
jgi:hypothetical protein